MFRFQAKSLLRSQTFVLFQLWLIFYEIKLTQNRMLRSVYILTQVSEDESWIALSPSKEDGLTCGIFWTFYNSIIMKAKQKAKTIKPTVNFQPSSANVSFDGIDKSDSIDNHNDSSTGKIKTLIFGLTSPGFSRPEKASSLQSHGQNLKAFCQNINKYRKPQGNKVFQKILNKARVKKLVKQFVTKISRSTRSAEQLSKQIEIKKSESTILDSTGFVIPSIIEKILPVLYIVNFIIYGIIISLGLAFGNQFIDNSKVKYVEVACCLVLVLRIMFGFSTVKLFEGKRLQKLRDMAAFYVKDTFCIDVITIFIIVLDICSDFHQIKFYRILFLVQLKDFKRNVQKIQNNLIHKFEQQQYWGICHIILGNILLAHIIAIFMLLIANLEPEHNWLTRSSFDGLPWYQQYIWAYYWAVTTMLSVGYGDIVASNYKEAICLAFIELFSCIILAYTISSVGSSISALRQNDLKKNRNFKIFKQIVSKNQISARLQEKVGSYISESNTVKKNFNNEEAKKLLSELPSDLREDILDECNSHVLKAIGIFQNLSSQFIREVASRIQLKIAHREEVILTPSSFFKVRILKEGKIGYYSTEGRLNKRLLMNEINVPPGGRSRLLSLNFFTNRNPSYCAVSTNYSVLYSLDAEVLRQILRNYSADSQKYLAIRDKSDHILCEFEVVECEHCPAMKHTRAECPRQHFMPLKQFVVFKNIEATKHSEFIGTHYVRRKNSMSCYQQYKHFREVQSEQEHFYIQSRAKTLTSKIVNEIFISQVEFPLDPTNMVFSNCSKQDSTAYSRKGINKSISYGNRQPIVPVECDMLYDFKHYFPQNNPKNIEKITDNKKIQRRKQLMSRIMKSGNIWEQECHF